MTHLHIAVPTKTRFYASRIHVLKKERDFRNDNENSCLSFLTKSAADEVHKIRTETAVLPDYHSTMAEILLDKEGLLLAGPSTSNEDNFENIFNESMELDVADGNADLLGQDNEDIESSQKFPPAKRQRREGKSPREPKSVTPINRKRPL